MAALRTPQRFLGWRALQSHERVEHGDKLVSVYVDSLDKAITINSRGWIGREASYFHNADYHVYRLGTSAESYSPHATAAPLPLP